jgi:hypothetical protein
MQYPTPSEVEQSLKLFAEEIGDTTESPFCVAMVARHGGKAPVYSVVIRGVEQEPIRKKLAEVLNRRFSLGGTSLALDANEAQVYSDVDSAYATLNGNLTLLRSFKAQYLQQAVRVRDTISFSYQNGGASLLDFLNAQNDYRNVQLSYLNLIGSYMKAASQMNLAVGKEVIQ